MKHEALIIAMLPVFFLTGCTHRAAPTATIEELKTAQVEVKGPLVPSEPAGPADIFSSTMKPTPLPSILPDAERQNKAAKIKTAKGEIVILLLSDEAPLTVSNFIWLARQKFYNGLTFHRVEPRFVVQGGDPNGDGTGGPGWKFNDEPVKRPYAAGTVAMANSGPNTNGSQFFIVLEDQPRLPPNYTIFGIVVRGMEAVRAIAPGDAMTSVEILNVQPQ